MGWGYSRGYGMEKILMSPVLLSPGSRLVVVFGGGPVALRKCRHFEGFRFRIIADKIMPELKELAEEIHETVVVPDSIDGYLEGADIVVAATSSHELNDTIRDVSMSKGIMTNSAHGGGDVLIPSTLERDGYKITVSSEGRVPAFPPYVIKAIDEFLDPSYDLMLELLVELRKEIRDIIPTQPARARFLADVLEDRGIWMLLKQNDLRRAHNRAMRKVDTE